MKKLLLASLWLLVSLQACAAESEQKPAPAPDFKLQTTDGKTVQLKDLQGQVVMINFWATWCGPCRKEMPALSQIYDDYKNAGFTLLGVNLDQEASEALAYLQKAPVSFPVLLDSKGQVADLYGNTAMPSSYFIDKQGRLAEVHQGYRPGDEEQYRTIIKQLLKQ